MKLLISILAGTLMYSCSGEDIIPDSNGETDPKEQVSLSLLLNASQQGREKSSGNQDKDAESKIYSLEVLIFKSEGDKTDSRQT